jgi:hypothetical protein
MSSKFLNSFSRVACSIIDCARRTSTIHLIDPLRSRPVPPLGRAPMLVYVRPSNEALLRARVPGAQDQCGCPSHPSYRARSASRRTARLPVSPFRDRALHEHRRSSASIPSSVLRARRAPGHSFPLLLRPCVPGAQDQCGCPSHPPLIVRPTQAEAP